MKRKNLEKAIILGLMAASISVPVWAAEGLWGENLKKEVTEGNLEITDDGTGIGFDGIVDVVNGDLIINAGDNGIASGWMENATLNIYADNIDITAKSNGIFTAIEDGYSGTVVIGSEDRKINSLTINSDQESIDSKNGTVTIYGADDSEIYIHAKGDGSKDRAVISNGYELDGKQYVGNTYIEGGNITLQADNGSGIINKVTDASGTTLVAQGKVNIVSKNETGKLKDNAGIKNMAGTTKIDAVNGIFIDSSNNGIYAEAGNVTLNGGAINKIDAVNIGTYATGAGTNVTLNAESNYIFVQNDTGNAENAIKGIYTSNGAIKEVNSKNETVISVDGNIADIAGIHADDGGTVNMNVGSLKVSVKSTGNKDQFVNGILAGNKETFIDNGSVETKANINAIVDNDINVDIYAANCDSYAIHANKKDHIDLTSKNGDIRINALDNVDVYSGATKYGVQVDFDGEVGLTAEQGSIYITSGDEEKHRGNNYGINNNGTLNIKANDVIVNSYSQGNNGVDGDGVNTKYGKTKIIADNFLQINSESYVDVANSKNYGVQLSGKGEIDFDAGSVEIASKGDISTAIYEWGSSTLNIDSHIGDIGIKAEAGTGKAQAVYVHTSSAELNSKNDIILIAQNNNDNAQAIGIYSNKSNVDLTGENSIYISTSKNDKLSSGHVIKAENSSVVNLNATAGDNVLAGVIYAKDNGTNVTLDHNIIDENGNAIKKGSGSNIIRSSAHGSEAEGRNHMVAALYAQNNGTIDIKAGEDGVNYIATDFSFEHADDSERTIWAQQGGKINIEGQTYIIASNSGEYTDGIKGNARGIAITAGTGVITDSDGNVLDEFKDPETGALAYIKDADRSTVNLDYKNSGDGILHSFIKGDLVSGYGGLIQVNSVKGSGLDMMGNALAANGGILELDLGNGGTWYGRADDYGDAGYGNDAKNHENFYNPAFSNEIIEGGTVNITMGEGSKWYLTGQSWVSSLDISEANGNAVINMAYDGDTHGLTIGSLNGTADGKSDATFIMALNHDNHEESDMLYVKNATGEYDVVINDMIDGIENINENNVLRFATVKGGATFENVTMKDTGIYNLEFEVDHSEYNENDTKENSGYNGESIDTNKPGNGNVEDFFRDENDENSKNNIMLLDENLKEDPDSVQNWYITSVKGQDISDGGKTVVNMSKVNYSNAVYMDRINKRLGEARYINTEEDQGMWVRMRHDRIGKDNEFRIMNTMYELGYDEKQECDNGERRVGAAIDYMDGSSEYTGVGGSGDVSRKGIWLYDTWLGDKGHYSDFVAKWGHLSNDFTLYRGGDKITGDFSNNVYSISAEYGRKKDIGNNWYFEPQVQLQYARVTDANYTTSQGTEVSLDAINSLIARAGFRLGKDLGERSTVYFKADVLHEFLGDQDIYAHDKTGTMDVTYGNEGTWCDIGFGFATAMSKTSYAYLDVETSLGNDYEETYQINAGLQWSF